MSDGMFSETKTFAPASYTVEELAQLVEILRSAGVKTFSYRDLQLSFDGPKQGNATEALRNPALRALLNRPL